MRKNRDQHIHISEHSYYGNIHTSKKVSDEQKKQQEALEKVIKNDIDYLVKLAQYYYSIIPKKGDENDENEEVEEEYTQVEENNNKEDIYTLIKDPKDQKKDVLVLIKTGEIPEITDTEKEKNELRKYFQGPLPIFVIHPRVKKENPDKTKRFLEENAILHFSPDKGGKVEVRITDKQKKHPINYNNIAQYTDAITIFQNAIFHKMFPNDKTFKKCVKKMNDLKTYDPEKLYKRSKDNRDYNQDEDEKILYNMIRESLVYMSEGDNEKLFNLIQSFDTLKKIFIK